VLHEDPFGCSRGTRASVIAELLTSGQGGGSSPFFTYETEHWYASDEDLSSSLSIMLCEPVVDNGNLIRLAIARDPLCSLFPPRGDPNLRLRVRNDAHAEAMVANILELKANLEFKREVCPVIGYYRSPGAVTRLGPADHNPNLCTNSLSLSRGQGEAFIQGIRPWVDDPTLLSLLKGLGLHDLQNADPHWISFEGMQGRPLIRVHVDDQNDFNNSPGLLVDFKTKTIAHALEPGNLPAPLTSSFALPVLLRAIMSLPSPPALLNLLPPRRWTRLPTRSATKSPND
jgi:hypothetical protein